MMRNEFISGEFNQYKVVSLLRANMDPSVQSLSAGGFVKVFISHKHDDLEDLKGIIGFLEHNYPVKCYIDGLDSTMPQITSVKTAEKLKNRIQACNKFILLATTSAIESKWCNWELGYADAKKGAKDTIAIFPVKLKMETPSDFRGNEYMELYPSVVYRDGNDAYSNGEPIDRGYYVRTKKQDGKGYALTPLHKWFGQ